MGLGAVMREWVGNEGGDYESDKSELGARVAIQFVTQRFKQRVGDEPGRITWLRVGDVVVPEKG